MREDKVKAKNLAKMTDIVMEFLDVATNQVLYHRSVYPKAVFQLRSCYVNVPVYQVQDTAVKNYVQEGLASLRSLLTEESCNLERFEVALLNGQEDPIEVYSFRLAGLTGGDGSDPLTSVPDYRQIQQDFRGVLLQLNSKMADLRPLPIEDDDDEISFTFRTKLWRNRTIAKRGSGIRSALSKSTKDEDDDDEIRDLNWRHLTEKEETGLSVNAAAAAAKRAKSDEDSIFGSLEVDDEETKPAKTIIPVAKFHTFLDVQVQIETVIS